MKMVSVSAQILMVLGLVTMLSGCDDDKKSATDGEASPNVGANYQESRPFDEARGYNKANPNSPILEALNLPPLTQATAEGIDQVSANVISSCNKGLRSAGNVTYTKLDAVTHIGRGGLRDFGKQRARWNDVVVSFAGMYQVDPNIIHAIISVESGYVEDIKGPQTRMGQARGLMQLIESTAAGLGVTNPNDLLIGAINIKAGTRYLREQLENFDFNPSLMAAAYNAGPGRVRGCGKNIPPFKETMAYTQRVAGYIALYKANKL